MNVHTMVVSQDWVDLGAAVTTTEQRLHVEDDVLTVIETATTWVNGRAADIQTTVIGHYRLEAVE